MSRHQIPVAMLEFEESGHTIWVHSPRGSTVLRIKTLGKIMVNRDCQNSVAHVDVITSDDIEICIPPRSRQ
jgi:hypothetical protein